MDDHLKLLEEILNSYSNEETKARLDGYPAVGLSIGEFITQLEEREKNLWLYGNSWTNEELELIIYYKGETK